MLYQDANARLQFARERADELARDYRRAQRAAACEAYEDARRARSAGLDSLLTRLRRRRLERAAAYRA